MKELEFLVGVAKISVAYVGFATLIVVIAQQFSGARALIEAARLIGMLRLGLMAVVFSLLPYFPFYLDLSTQAAWRVSCFLLGVVWLVYYLERIHWIRSKEHKEAVQYLSHGNRFNLFVTHPFGIVCVLLGAFGVWGERVGFVYLCGIFVLLIMSAYIFMGLVTSIASRKPE